MEACCHTPKVEKPSVPLRAYLPLAVIIAITLLAALALAASGSMFMNGFMGLFLCVFAMFKLFDIRGFADGFQTYDIIAKPFRPYAYAYPFIELTLGLAYLAHAAPIVTNVATLSLMFVSMLGVISGIRSGSPIKCACLGTLLNVPLSTVSVVENAGMGIMAAYMLLK